MSHGSFRLPTGLIHSLLFALFVLPASGQIQSTLTDVHHDVSRPLRDLANTAPAQDVEEREAEPPRRIPIPAGVKPAEVLDPVLQQTTVEAPTLVGPTQGLNFEGMGIGLPGFFIAGAPPDTNGGGGTTQKLQGGNP